ncbi:CPBP family intramembrane glutamic endopeptidase [Chungangia koreensis]|uniref:CPBP family intramembrane glutamic endopeptidase n=1 Tax=Chungangia koreensis TaxID=752657 RepID=A0ABV8X5Y5_9LACT
MKKSALILSIICIFFLLWIEQGIGVAYIVKTAAKVVLFLFVPLLLFKKRGLDFLSFRKTDRKAIRMAVVSGFSIMLLIIGAFIIVKSFIDTDSLLLDLQTRVGVTGAIYPFVALYILFGNSFLEEFFFRGFLTGAFQGSKMRWILPPLFFAVYHIAIFLPWFTLPVLLLALAGLWIGGYIFQWINEKSGTILPSWIIHMFADLGILFVGAYLFYF